MNLLDKIGLGTVQFGLKYGISNTTGVTPLNEIHQILDYCSQKKINIIDTAFGYGESESNLGKNKLDSFKIVSKFLPPDTTKQSIQQQLVTSLGNLNQKALYGYLAHRPLDVCADLRQWIDLNSLKEMGLVKKIGFSFNEPQELKKVLQKKLIPDIIQVPYNLFDNRFEPFFFELKEKYNCEIHIRSVFLQGLFFTNSNELPSFFDTVKSEIQQIQKWGPDLPSALIKYVLTNENIDCAVLGINSLKQLKANIEGINNVQQIIRPKKFKFDSEILIPSKWPIAGKN